MCCTRTCTTRGHDACALTCLVSLPCFMNHSYRVPLRCSCEQLSSAVEQRSQCEVHTIRRLANTITDVETEGRRSAAGSSVLLCIVCRAVAHPRHQPRSIRRAHEIALLLRQVASARAAAAASLTQLQHPHGPRVALSVEGREPPRDAAGLGCLPRRKLPAQEQSVASRTSGSPISPAQNHHNVRCRS